MLPLSDEIRTVLVLTALFTIPGWFLLALTGAARSWSALQRWCLAVGLSIAFYPVLMYFLRLVPGLRMGQNKWVLLLALMLLATFGLLWKDWRKNKSFILNLSLHGWLAVGILFAVLFTRLWMAHLHPYPAWSDSLHHTLLTQLTAGQGRLPETLEPYAPTPLAMYHLGLYAISGTLMLLAKIPAYAALVWAAQAMNGLCGLGIFLVLDRKIGRAGAVVGAAVVGLFSFQPAWYYNWGRFTQAASQAVLPIAWLVTWEAMQAWQSEQHTRRSRWSLALLSGLLNAAVFLLHFRVAYFYLPLLLVTLLFELFRARSTRSLRPFVAAVIVTGVISVILVAPAVFSAARAYYISRTVNVELPVEVSQQADGDAYYAFPLDSVTVLGVQPWLLVGGAIALGYNLIRRSRFSLLVIFWIALMILEGLAYLLRIPLLNVTNLGAVLILLYMPLGLVVGEAAEGIWRSGWFQSPAARQAAVGVFLFAAFISSHIRVNGLEEDRFFLTSADVQAMTWVAANTPADSRFAVNTYFWLPASPHGSDAGFWLPYFAQRETNTGTMLFSLGPAEYVQKVIRQSLAVRELREQDQSVERLCQEGLDYIYLGAKGDFSGNGFDPARLAKLPGIEPVYDQSNVKIYKLNCP